MGSPDEVRHERLAELRRRMAAIPARGVASAARAPLSRERRRESLPVPSALGELLPEGGLVRGEVVEYWGASALLAGLLASVTGAGGHAAAVGLPRLGLLAAAEMGADLERLAVIPDPGPDPLEVASILLDGLALVMIGMGGRAVPPARARVLSALPPSTSATLMVAGGRWSGSVLRIDTRIAGYGGLGRGCGRLRTMRLDVRVQGRSVPYRTGTLDLTPRGEHIEWVAAQADSAVPTIAEARHAAS